MEDVLERWRSEKTAGYLSAAVAAAEPDPGKAALFREMADAAEEQAGILAKELHETPPFSPRSGRVSRPFSLGPSAPAPCAPSSRPQRSAVCQSIAARCRPDIRGPLPSRTWVAVTNLMAAARSGQGCSTSTTGSCPIPVAGAAAEPSVLILTGVAGLPPAPSPWPPESSSPCSRKRKCSSIRSRRSSGKGVLLGGLRMLLIGTAAAGATYGIGSLFNVAGL